MLFRSIYYDNNLGAKHTQDQVAKIRNLNYKVLSYFVSDRPNKASTDYRIFEKMYGKDAVICDVTSVVNLAKTLNDVLLAPTHK